jgi:hypothetical protein
MKKAITSLLWVLFLIDGFSVFGQQPDTVKILAIGNSFSEDVLESYCYDIASVLDKPVSLGNVYIGGCSLEKHWDNASNNLKVYSYRKIKGGIKTKYEQQALTDFVPDEDWDYITLQQVSQNSGLINTFFPYLTNLKQYVMDLATNPTVRFALHQTWAYAINSSHSGFANYQRNQTVMYDSILCAVNNAAQQADIQLIIPSGTASNTKCKKHYNRRQPMSRWFSFE